MTQARRITALLLTALLLLSSASADAPYDGVVSVAVEELGYQESARGETKYGEWAGDPTAQWCTEFVSWCVNEADARQGTAMLGSVYPQSSSATGCKNWFVAQGRFVGDSGKCDGRKQWLSGASDYLPKDGYTPVAGDVVFLCLFSADKGMDHAALVEGTHTDASGALYVDVIEGNWPDTVQRASYLRTDRRIYGFGLPEARVRTVLAIYNRGADVSALRDRLTALGYDASEPGQEDVFTQALRKLVKAWQQAEGLKVTGRIDLADAARLYEEEA